MKGVCVEDGVAIVVDPPMVMGCLAEATRLGNLLSRSMHLCLDLEARRLASSRHPRLDLAVRQPDRGRCIGLASSLSREGAWPG